MLSIEAISSMVVSVSLLYRPGEDLLLFLLILLFSSESCFSSISVEIVTGDNFSYRPPAHSTSGHISLLRISKQEKHIFQPNHWNKRSRKS